MKRKRQRDERERNERSEKECLCKQRERIADVRMEDSIKYIYTDTCVCIRGKEKARERRANGKRIAREPKGV